MHFYVNVALLVDAQLKVTFIDTDGYPKAIETINNLSYLN